MVGISSSARAEGPAAPCPDVPAAAPVDARSEELAFNREVERYFRYRAFTERLVAERAAREFAQEETRHERFRKLTEKLTLEAEQATEREFERAIELYLVKVRLTKELSERGASTPVW
jgi:hypothetical protein